MSKGLYVVGTGTDVGKTYISALLLKALRRGGYDAGYYKAVVSGAPSFAESDAAYVNGAAAVGEPQELLLSYRYAQARPPPSCRTTRPCAGRSGAISRVMS